MTGPVIGGFIAESYISWRWCEWINSHWQRCGASNCCQFPTGDLLTRPPQMESKTPLSADQGQSLCVLRRDSRRIVQSTPGTGTLLSISIDCAGANYHAFRAISHCCLHHLVHFPQWIHFYLTDTGYGKVSTDSASSVLLSAFAF